MSKYKKLIAFFLATWALLFLTYDAYSVGLADKTFYLQLRRYLPCALAMTIAYGCWTRFYPAKALTSHVLVFSAWLLTYPLFYYLTFGQAANFIDNHFDIAFAAYLFAASVLLQLILTKYLPSKQVQRFITALQLFALVIPCVQVWYFYSYQSVMTSPGIMALLQTNPAEAEEFLKQNLGYSGIAGIAAAFACLGMLLHSLNQLPLPLQRLKGRLISIMALLLVAVVIYLVPIFKETGVMRTYLDTNSYFQAAEKFSQYHEGNLAALQVAPSKPGFAQPSTIIMVIGESATSDYMSAYHPGERNNTPWMTSLSTTPQGYLFQHAYASWGQTVPALERALTEKNQYNKKEFNQSLTILDLAKKAGYTTYWFSNQGTVGDADTPITLVAKTADHSAWIADNMTNKEGPQEYDGNLVPFLEQVDPSQNNFIVFHLMGSHDSFINRYPASFTKWGEPGKQDLILNYENSLAYTDAVLEQIYQAAQTRLHLQALVYFSDHGVIPDKKRMPDQTNFQALRIPLFAYLSPEYQGLYPATAQALDAHKDSYFTNDLVYELMAGLLNIQSPAYNPANSLADTKYQFTRETLTTRLGETPLTEDPGLPSTSNK